MQYRQTKDGLTVIIANNGSEYQQYAKKYVVNMCRNRKMLHQKNCCYYSKGMYEFISFDDLEEAGNLPFSVAKCQKCFPNQ